MEPTYVTSSDRCGESSHCVAVAACETGACVAVSARHLTDGGDVEILVSDTKNPDQKPLRFTVAEWESFLSSVRAGRFDVLELLAESLKSTAFDHVVWLPLRDERPHSRACGIAYHEHGPSCTPDCPTCYVARHGTRGLSPDHVIVDDPAYSFAYDD